MDVGKNSTKTYVQNKYEILGRKIILLELGEKCVLQVTNVVGREIVAQENCQKSCKFFNY